MRPSLPQGLARLVVALGAVLFGACVPLDGGVGEDLEPIGAFDVSAELDSTSCGDASDVSFLPSFEEYVELSRLGRQIVWQVGRSRFVGELEEDDRSFVVRSVVQLDATLPPEGPEPEERVACVIRRIEEIRGTLEEDDRSFAGRIGYRYEATPGSDCERELSATPPLVEELPCEARYELVGELAR